MFDSSLKLSEDAVVFICHCCGDYKALVVGGLCLKQCDICLFACCVLALLSSVS